jgi:hypothetical protein
MAQFLTHGSVSGTTWPRFRPLSSLILSFQKCRQNSLKKDAILNLQRSLCYEPRSETNEECDNNSELHNGPAGTINHVTVIDRIVH